MSNNFVDLTGDDGNSRAADTFASAPAGADSLPDLHAPLAINICSDILDIDGGPEDTVFPELKGLAEAIGKPAAAAAQSNKANQPPKFRPKKPKSRENSVSSKTNNDNNSVGGVEPAPLSRDTSMGDSKLPASSDERAKKKRKRRHSREKSNPRSVSGESHVFLGHNLAVRSESGGSAGRGSHGGRGYEEGGRGRGDYGQRNSGRGSAAGRGGGNTAGRIAGRGPDPRCKQGRGRGGRITFPTAQRRHDELIAHEQLHGPTNHHDFHGRGWDGRQPPRAEELNVRMQQLQKLSTAQAKKQAELDSKSVALEARERELEAREKKRGKHQHGDSDALFPKQVKRDEEFNTHMQPLEKRSTALAIQQKELDGQSVNLEARERELEAREKAFDKKCRDSESEIAANRQQIEQLREKGEREILQLRRNAECEIARLRKETEREMEQVRSENEREMQRLRAKNEQEIDRRTEAAHEACSKLEQQIECRQRDLEKLRRDYDTEKDTQRRELDVARQECQLEMDAERKAVETSRTEFEKEEQAVRAAMELTRQELEHKAQLQEEEERHLEAEVAEQRSREVSWVIQKESAEASLRQKQDLLDIREKSQQRKALELSRLQKALEATKAKQQKEFQEWAVARASQQEEAEEWINSAKSENAKRRSELEARAAALTRQQKELEVRAAAQRKRAKGLKAALQVNARKSSDGSEDAAKPEPRKPNDMHSASISSGRQHANDRKDSDEAEANGKPSTQHDGSKEHPSGESDGCDFVLLDSESEDERHDEPAPETRQQYRFNYQDEYNYNFSTESASEIQDRLFREAAEKMRAQAAARVASAPASKAFEFSSPVFNIAERYPNHWKWKSPHAVLGLPPNATMKLIKFQYRRLARTYHPDKSTVPNSAAKFHSISTAYHKILQHE